MGIKRIINRILGRKTVEELLEESRKDRKYCSEARKNTSDFPKVKNTINPIAAGCAVH